MWRSKSFTKQSGASGLLFCLFAYLRICVFAYLLVCSFACTKQGGASDLRCLRQFRGCREVALRGLFALIDSLNVLDAHIFNVLDTHFQRADNTQFQRAGYTHFQVLNTHIFNVLDTSFTSTNLVQMSTVPRETFS
jgi:hypothetical protein